MRAGRRRDGAIPLARGVPNSFLRGELRECCGDGARGLGPTWPSASANSSRVKIGREPQPRGPEECYLPGEMGMENSRKGYASGVTKNRQGRERSDGCGNSGLGVRALMREKWQGIVRSLVGIGVIEESNVELGRGDVGRSSRVRGGYGRSGGGGGRYPSDRGMGVMTGNRDERGRERKIEESGKWRRTGGVRGVVIGIGHGKWRRRAGEDEKS